MLITKFNRMIRSRVLWGAFAFLISVAFVFTFSEVGGCSRDGAAQRGVVGILFDQDVRHEEFLQARFFELGLRGNANLAAEEEERLTQEVWKRLATLRMAERLALRIGDEELSETIQRDRSFWVNDVFSAQQYKQAVQRQLGIGISTFEDFLREQQTLDKMRQLAASMVWVSPLEMAERLRDLTDERSAAYVLVSREKHTPSVTLSEDEVRAFYQANTNLFVEPERVSVRYVQFDSAPSEKIPAPTDEAVSAYYEANRDELYSTADTNGGWIVTPLDDVRDAIVAKLRDEAAREAAMTAATDFAVALAPGRFAAGIPFDQAAVQAGVSIHTTGLFGAAETVPGLEVGEPFRRAAFALDPEDKDFYFSDAVAESNAVYVVAVDNRVQPFVPEFESIRDAVTPVAMTSAISEAFTANVAEIRSDILQRMGEGLGFAEAADAMGLGVTTTGVFSVYMGLPDETPHANVLPSALISIGKDGLSMPVAVEDGSLLVCELSRKPAEAGMSQFLRPQLLQSLKRFRAASIYDAWRDALLVEAEFQDLTKRLAPADDDEERERKASEAAQLL